MKEIDVAAVPRDERRLLIVAQSEVVKRLRTPPAPAAALRELSRKLLAYALGGPAFMIVGAVQEFRDKAKNSDFDGELLTITDAESQRLNFPPGHPVKKVMYVLHPLDPETYVPMAEFHTFIFQHKVAEALRLLTSLGAESIEIVHVHGWGEESGIIVDVPLPGTESLNVGAAAGRNRSKGEYVMTRMTLRPTAKPFLPDGLRWIDGEPLWGALVRARLESGLSSFDMLVQSTGDYGVNASLKALVDKTGLEMGGSFVKHESTAWRLQGTFAA